jgi:hypothetical protein
MTDEPSFVEYWYSQQHFGHRNKILENLESSLKASFAKTRLSLPKSEGTIVTLLFDSLQNILHDEGITLQWKNQAHELAHELETATRHHKMNESSLELNVDTYNEHMEKIQNKIQALITRIQDSTS